MIRKILIATALITTSLFAEFTGLTPLELQKQIDKNTVVIDIRTPPEWKDTGIVPTSHKIMFFDERGNYNIEKWMNKFNKLVKNQNQPFILVCRSGNRTGQVGNYLSQKLNYKNVYHLQNGIKSWIKEKRIVNK